MRVKQIFKYNPGLNATTVPSESPTYEEDQLSLEKELKELINDLDEQEKELKIQGDNAYDPFKASLFYERAEAYSYCNKRLKKILDNK